MIPPEHDPPRAIRWAEFLVAIANLDAHKVAVRHEGTEPDSDDATRMVQVYALKRVRPVPSDEQASSWPTEIKIRFRSEHTYAEELLVSGILRRLQVPEDDPGIIDAYNQYGRPSP